MSHLSPVRRTVYIAIFLFWATTYIIFSVVDTVSYAPDWFSRGNVIGNLVALMMFAGVTVGYYLVNRFEKEENIYIQEGTKRNELIVKLHKDIDSLVEALQDESPQEREYIPAALRKYVTERDRCTCFYCGKIGTRRHDHRKRTWNIDHLLPISRGGSNAPSNLVLACENCNLSKNDKTAAEFFYYKYWRYIRQEEQAATKKQ